MGLSLRGSGGFPQEVASKSGPEKCPGGGRGRISELQRDQPMGYLEETEACSVKKLALPREAGGGRRRRER